MRTRWHIRWLALIVAIAMMMSVAVPVLAASSYPAPGMATVDGDPSEWDLTFDFFAKMYEAGKPEKDWLSSVYLRYDCTSKTLYVLVLAEEGYQIMANKPEDHWVKIYDLGNSTLVDGSSGNDGTPPDFAWVNKNGDVADGWEASISLDPKTYKALEVHAQIVGDKPDGRTSSTGKDGIPLTLQCLSLGNFIWDDQNSNGIQDNGEPGIGGVPVWLFAGACDTSLDYNSMTPRYSTTTYDDGMYEFATVSGSYCVIIPSSAFNTGGPLAGRDPSLQGQGSDSTRDSKGELQSTYNYVWTSVTLTSDDDTIDFGFFSAPPTAVTLASLSARSGAGWPVGMWALATVGVLLATGAAAHRYWR